MSNNEVAVAPLKVAIRELAKNPQVQARFAEVLKNRGPQFIASVIAVADTLDPRTDAKSIMSAAMTAAVLDLPVDKNLGFAWIVPYNSRDGMKAQFQMGYKGYVQLAIRTGQYRFINVVNVYEGELVGVDKLTSEVRLDETKRISDTVVGYAAFFRTINGFEHAEYWTKEAVTAHANRFSQAFRSGRDGPWKSDFDAMARKTVIKSLLSHYGILSVEMQRGLQRDHGVTVTLDPNDTSIEFPDNVVDADEKPQDGPPKRRSKAKETVVVATEVVQPAAQEPTEPGPETQEPPDHIDTSPAKTPEDSLNRNPDGPNRLEFNKAFGAVPFTKLQAAAANVNELSFLASAASADDLTEEQLLAITRKHRTLNHTLSKMA